jgi:hypothetical protein
LTLFDHGAAGLVQPGITLVQLIACLGLNAEMVETRLPATGRYGEVDTRIVEHPLGVVRFDH